MVKVTFTLDAETVERLRRLATRLHRSRSQVIRDCIKEYEMRNEHELRSDRPGEDERRRMLEGLDRIMKAPPTRPQAEVDAELREIRAARRRWARREPR